MMSNLWECAAALVAAAVVGAPVLADEVLSYVTDIRRCSATYSGNGFATTSESRREPFGPFEGGADLNITNGLETWVANAAQVSGMDGASMNYIGSASAVVFASPTSEPLFALGQSKFDIFFTVAQPTDYTLGGEMSREGHREATAFVILSLVGAGDPVIVGMTAVENGVQAFHWQGTLEPGMYRLRAEANGRCRTLPPEIEAHGAAACRMEFHAAARMCPADWNADGNVESVDVFSFLQDFFAVDADFDHDGVTNSEDLFGYLVAFQSGC